MAEQQYPESGGFPDSHTTTTHMTTTHQTTTQQTTSSSMECTVDKGYVMSIPGILRIVEIVVGFLYWTVVASYYYSFSGYSWVIFVGVTSWIFTVVLFVLFVLTLTRRVTIINWVLTELINNAAWCLLHFIAAILISVRAGQNKRYIEHGKLVFGSLCGWALFVLYGLSTFLNFRQFMAMGGLGSIRGGPGATAATTTTTTTTTVGSTHGGIEEKGQEQPPPYPGGPFT